MAETLGNKLIGYVQDAHAMECSVARMLDSMIGTTTDPEILARFTEHRRETERHVQLLLELAYGLGDGGWRHPQNTGRSMNAPGLDHREKDPELVEAH